MGGQKPKSLLSISHSLIKPIKYKNLCEYNFEYKKVLKLSCKKMSHIDKKCNNNPNNHNR